MAKLSRDKNTTTLHPREDLVVSGTLGALNAEIIVATDGCGTIGFDARGTFSMTVELSGSVDGVNYVPIPIRPVGQALVRYVAAITGTVQGVWVGTCSQYVTVRARVTAFTSGSMTATLLNSTATLDSSLQGLVTTDIVTVTAAAGVIATLSLPAPGAGLRQYITYISINRVAAALLSAAATPVLVTTTNIPGALIFSIPADAAAQGTGLAIREDFTYPIASTALNTATTIVGPATTGTIWRITAGYYVAP